MSEPQGLLHHAPETFVCPACNSETLTDEVGVITCDCGAEIAVLPDFPVCGVCGAAAHQWVVWDQGDGWTCTKCWSTDGGD